MKMLLAFPIMLALLPQLQAQTTESCELSVSIDGSVKVAQCAPALVAPFILTVTAQSAPATPPPPPPPPPPPNTVGDNRYCDKTGHWTGLVNENGVLAPTSCFYTGSDATPSLNPATILKATDDLTKIYAAARCGDVLRLAPGGQYTLAALPSKQCDDAHWVTIRADVADDLLPAEGTRITPCAIGLASLPARPLYACGTPVNNLPKITNAAIPRFSGDHIRFIGIEFTRPAGNSKAVYGLAQIANADKMIFDRCIFHGDPNLDTVRAIILSDSSTNIAIIDSYFYDFHCEAMGACGDSQAISGGMGNAIRAPTRS